MVEDRVTDGRRIAQLLASEIRGRERGPLGPLSIVTSCNVEGSKCGEFAYGIDREPMRDATDGERLADVYIHDDRTRVEFRAGMEAAAATADSGDLRNRPKGTRPPRTLVFVESGAEVKRAADAVGKAAAAAANSNCNGNHR